MSSVEQRIATDPRISRRRRAIERSRRRRICTRLAVVVALGALGWVAFWSPVLAVRDVTVVGARHTTAEQIARAAGIDGGENLLLLSVASVSEAAESLPWVARARVDRVLPGTVRVRLIERRPALVASLGAARWTIDRRGHVLASGAAVKGLPALAAGDLGDVRPGTRLTTPSARAALRTFRSLPPALRRSVRLVVAPTSERITFSLASGTVIRYGSSHRMHAKNEVLRALLRRLRHQDPPAYIDVRVPINPAIASQGAAPAASPSPAAGD